MGDISIANVHLDLGAGRRGVDMGPSAIHLAGLKQAIEKVGHRIAENHQIIMPSQEMAEVGDPHARYLKEIVATCTQLADEVEDAYEHGLLPVTLGGDHSVAIGSISDPYLQIHAAVALAYHGTPQALDLLRTAAAKEPPSSVRRAAIVDALGMLLARETPLRLAEVSAQANYTVFSEWVEDVFQTTL